MAIQILKEYEQDGLKVTEFTRDGVTMSHKVETPIPLNVEPQPTIDQQILAELQYNTALTETKMLGGM